jgi:alpha-glucosidase (family GH31 glycosyl hydrolase)
MEKEMSRRKMIARIGGASVGVLLSRRVAYAEMIGEPGKPESVPRGRPGMDVKIRAVTEHTLRISVVAVDEDLDRYYDDGSVVPRTFAKPMLTMRTDAPGQEIAWGEYTIAIATAPLRISLHHPQRGSVQQLTFRPDINQIGFVYGGPVYGMGPGVHPMDRRGVKDPMRNGAGDDLRVFGARNPIPWIMGKGWGLYFHEPGGTFDLTGEASGFFHPSDGARGQDLFVVAAATPEELLREYAEITGYPHLPAKWTFGFQQSHRTLESREQILEEAKTFREKRLPCDTLIYLGTGFCPSGWNTGHGAFAFNDAVFPDPEEIVRQFHAMHFNVVLHVVNPPENLHGHVSDTGTADMPGDAANYWKQHVPFVEMGIDGWWPDEGDVLPTASRLVRNRMYWEGGRMTRPDRRPFALHRNCYAGIQRWGWLWSGDTFSTWKTLETQIMMGINAGLSGVPYWGTDIGGFVPTKEFTAELYVRWFQFGAFCPSFRCHGRTWQLRRPWGWDTGSYGPSEISATAEMNLPKSSELHNAAVEPICRKFLNTRYELMPYLYSSAWATHRTGVPLIRSLGLSFPDDEKAWATADAYLFGPSLLVAPVFEQGAKGRKVYLPAGGWYDFWKGDLVQGGTTVFAEAELETLPLYVRAGAIVPTGPVKQYAAEPSSEPLRLTVYPGADGQSSVYDDDGLTFDYERGEFSVLDVAWNDATRTLRIAPGQAGRKEERELLVSIVGGKPRRITSGGRPQTLQM